MTTAQVVEMSVTVNNNSPIQDYIHPDNQFNLLLKRLRVQTFHILDTIDTKYASSKISVDESEEQTEIQEQIFLGGDQLTEERARNAKDARGDGDSSCDRLEGVISKIED